jgi:hypothetical protein
MKVFAALVLSLFFSLPAQAAERFTLVPQSWSETTFPGGDAWSADAILYDAQTKQLRFCRATITWKSPSYSFEGRCQLLDGIAGPVDGTTIIGAPAIAPRSSPGSPIWLIWMLDQNTGTLELCRVPNSNVCYAVPTT